MAPNYSANLQNFINNYNSFTTEMNSYETDLSGFYHQVDTLIANAETGISPNIQTSIDRNYLVTKNGFEFALNSINAEQDYVANKININNNFYVDPNTMTASDISFGPTGMKQFYTDTIIQGGLDDLQFRPNNIKPLSAGVEPVRKVSSSYSNQINTHSDGDCVVTDLHMCDSYAKMNDKPYYGLSRNDAVDGTSQCACYIFDDITSLPDFNQTITNVDITSHAGYTGISYLGIMFDNTFCSLKKLNYSKNFDDIYVENSNKYNEILNSRKITNCNKFTGSGLYGLNINSLNEDTKCDFLS